MFDVEYGRWQEEHYRLMYELRAALQQHLPEGELQMYVESCLAHHDEMMGIKEGAIKGDVFHLISGVWRSPAERCFLWLGGFRPSEVIKVRRRPRTRVPPLLASAASVTSSLCLAFMTPASVS